MLLVIYAGFIGSTFTEKLLEMGGYVYCIDKFTYVSTRYRLIELIMTKFMKNDLDKRDICEINWLPECDVIFNLAAESDVDVGNQDSALDFFKIKYRWC